LKVEDFCVVYWMPVATHNHDVVKTSFSYRVVSCRI